MEADLREMQENQGLSEIRIDKQEFLCQDGGSVSGSTKCKSAA